MAKVSDIERLAAEAEAEAARLRALAEAEAAGYPVCPTSLTGHPNGCRCR